MIKVVPVPEPNHLLYLGEDDYVKVDLRPGSGPGSRAIKAIFKTPEAVDITALNRMITHLQAAMGVFNT